MRSGEEIFDSNQADKSDANDFPSWFIDPSTDRTTQTHTPSFRASFAHNSTQNANDVDHPSTQNTDNTGSYYMNETSSRAQRMEGSSFPGSEQKWTEIQKKHPGVQMLWRECDDAKTGKKYYYNRRTKETTWKRPADTQMELLLIEGRIAHPYELR